MEFHYEEIGIVCGYKFTPRPSHPLSRKQMRTAAFNVRELKRKYFKKVN